MIRIKVVDATPSLLDLFYGYLLYYYNFAVLL